MGMFQKPISQKRKGFKKMKGTDLILKHFYASNYITLCAMYLKEYKKSQNLELEDLKEYNPGHLGSSTGVNFILSNLNYFLKEKNISSKLVIGTGHAGVALLSQLWLNGTMTKYYSKYPQNLTGLNNFIKDFGIEFRSEINFQYPEVIYDGGELGYSLSVSYGYALSENVDIIPCIIGDGEAETGALSSSWYLNKIVSTNSKVLPIINLNGLKMSSSSYFSKLSNEEIEKYFTSLGYFPYIVDTNGKNINNIIEIMQQTLNSAIDKNYPIIIFKSKKGWGMNSENNDFEIEGELISHKNPFSTFTDKEKKLKILKEILEKYDTELFDSDDNLDYNIKKYFYKNDEIIDKKTEVNIPKKNEIEVDYNQSSMLYVEKYLEEFLSITKSLIFSPDEIYSNQLGELSGTKCIEMLNEIVLQGLMQGYAMSGNIGFYVSYEGFMPIISSMLEQYWKTLFQIDNSKLERELPSLNYILTSICWENTYSHQNPSFINQFLIKNDKHINILFPKDGNSFIKCINENISKNNCINIITISKRCNIQYKELENYNNRIEILYDNDNIDIVLCAIGDIMLKKILELKEELENKYNINSRVIYITNPKILDIASKESLTNYQFNNYFPKEVPCLYLFSGYSDIIKSFLYDRERFFHIMGYNDMLNNSGRIEDVLSSNGITIDKLSKKCNKVLKRTYIERKDDINE